MEKTALVVDNDFFFVEFLTELLESRGYTVTKAYDGKEGMEKLDFNDFTIMFADMVMPKVDGWQLIKYVREKYPSRPFPIVAVSGTIIEQLDTLEKINADYYIAKGPVQKMKVQFNTFMEKIEAQPHPEDSDDPVFDLGKIYPRRESIALIEALNFQRAIFNSMGLGMLVVDRDAKTISANGQALEILGLNELAVINHKLPLLLQGEKRTMLIHVMKKVAKERQCNKGVINQTLNGREVRIIVSVLSYEEKDAGWVVALEDLEACDEKV